MLISGTFVRAAFKVAGPGLGQAFLPTVLLAIPCRLHAGHGPLEGVGLRPLGMTGRTCSVRSA